MTADDRQLELLTAYLDGEVTAEEQARCEALLESSEAHRRLFEQLQAVSDRVQQLPQVRLDDAFADRVLAAAASTPPPSVTAGGPQIETNGSVPRKPAPPAWWRTPQGLAGLALVVTVAALVALAALIPDRQRPVADPGPNPRPPVNDSRPSIPEAAPQLAGNQGPGEASPKAIAKAQPGDTSPDSAIESIAASSPQSRIAAAPSQSADAHLIAQQPAAAPTRFMLVVDVELTQDGIDARTFDTALQNSGVPVGPTIRMNADLERALIASRLGQPGEAPQPPDDQQTPQYAELVYVKGRGPGFDALLATLLNAKAEVAAVRMDVAQGTDVDLFQQLDRAGGDWVLADAGSARSRFQPEGEGPSDRNPGAESAPKQNGFAGQARRIVLTAALQSRIARPMMIASLPASAMMSALQPGAAPAALAPPKNGEPARSAEFNEKMQKLLDLEFQVLFVLRKSE